AEGIVADQYVTGGMILRGWPLSVESAALSSSEGTVKVPGFTEPILIGSIAGGRERSRIVIGPVRIALGGNPRDVILAKRRHLAPATENAADLTFTQDFNTDAGGISAEASLPKSEDLLQLAAQHAWTS